MDQNKTIETNNKEKRKRSLPFESTPFIIKLGITFIVLTVIIFSGILRVSTEGEEYRETITNLKFDYNIIRGMLETSQSELKQANQEIVELKTNITNLHLEQHETKHRLVTLQSELTQANQKTTELKTRISRKSIVEFTRSKPALTKWVFENSSKISKEIAKEIVNYTLETNFPLFLLSLIKTESTFDPTSVSSKGALGLGQVMPRDYEKGLKKAGILTEMRDIFNIPVGVKATEFAWNDKLVIAEGDIIKALSLYLGKKKEDYINQILKDFLYLNYLCRKPEASFGLSHTPLELQDGRLKIPNKEDNQ